MSYPNVTDIEMFINKKVFFPTWQSFHSKNRVDQDCATYADFIHTLSTIHYNNIILGVYSVNTLLTNTTPQRIDRAKNLGSANIQLIPLPPPPVSSHQDDNNNNATAALIGNHDVIDIHSVSDVGSQRSDLNEPAKFFYLPQGRLYNIDKVPKPTATVDLASILAEAKFVTMPRLKKETNAVMKSRSVAHHPSYLRMPLDPNAPEEKTVHNATLLDDTDTTDILMTFYGTVDVHKLNRRFGILGDKMAISRAMRDADKESAVDATRTHTNVNRDDIFERVFSMLSPDPDTRKHDLYDLPTCSEQNCRRVAFEKGKCMGHTNCEYGDYDEDSTNDDDI